MADIICSVLGDRCVKYAPEESIKEFKRRADSYTGHKNNLIFAHAVVDTCFQKSWTKLEEKNYYNSLRLAYETIHMDKPYASFYEKIWIHALRERLKKETSLIDYKLSVERLYDYTQQNNISQDKLMYIFTALEEMKDQMEYKEESQKAVLYQLYNSGVSAYCHLGKPDIAKQYFEKCKEYARHIDFETFIRTRDKLSVCLCDEFSYKEAEKLAEENVFSHEEMSPLRRIILNDDSEKLLNYGRALSQWGQTLAFQRKTTAEEQFRKALQQMEENSPNYFITLSYLLHFYLDMDMKDKYKTESVWYFGGKTALNEQFSYILTEGNKGRDGKISLKFALYVFVRGISRYYSQKIDGQLFSELMNIEAVIKKKGERAETQIGGHPWELIYKHLAFIAWDKGNKNKAVEYMKKTKTAVKAPGKTIDMLCWFGQMEFALYTGKKESAEKYFNKAPDTFEKNGEFWEELRSKEGFEEAYHYLNSTIFTFMYR